MESPAPTLAPPAVAHLRAQQAYPMERSISQDIRDEREELREAAEQTLNAIVDLNLDGTVRWASPSWADVVGTKLETLDGKQLSELVVSDNKNVFSEVVEGMKRDDSRSHRIRFTMELGPLSKLRSAEAPSDGAEASPETIELEAQGIMVYDSASGGESHTMWMIRPWTPPTEILIDLPDVIVDSLGSGGEVLASFLNQLAECGGENVDSRVKPPPTVLCRICERQIQPWWFEKHTDLCLQEHRAEMDVQMAQENLQEHRHAIVKVLDALESRQSRPTSGEQQQQQPNPLPLAEYKGMPIGPPPSTQSSPGTSMARSRDRSGGFGHNRTRSFAVRRPQARIVELLMDLCDTALEVSTPSLKESAAQQDGELRTQSPQSESRISQVLQWQSPSTNTVEQEQGLAALCADTEKVARAKVDAVFRHRKIIEYAERIRVELAVLVQDCIDEAMRKAARIAAGQFSDTSEDEGEERQPNEYPLGNVEEEVSGQENCEQGVPSEDRPASVTDSGDEPRGRDKGGPLDKPQHSPSALATALRQADLNRQSRRSHPPSVVPSTRSSSPRECLTPRSHLGAPGGNVQPRDIPREQQQHVFSESETVESEGSLRSSSLASRAATRTESPISEFGDLRRAASSRQHHRRSLVLPGTSSPGRQPSPSRPAPPPSPLRIKPRGMPIPGEIVVSPEGSPMLGSSEFSSPVIHPVRHHRRQSSAAISDFVMKPPPSPRLHANQAPPQGRSTQPSIKDFEIIKPISKGAFGSVYLSKKKSTGEYFAIKVLKKADMVAKNQVGNVKAERAIMMWQGQSEFVAKLYWTFSSKDYLYLVMEYLNGGDCASLIKILGGLPEDWVRKYLGEVVLGVEHLHSRGIIHRDLKPDNLLIDQKGHLKLTDFGLSRMGLVGRQKRALNSTTEATPDLLKQGPFARSTSMASSRSTSLDLHGHSGGSPGGTPHMTPEVSGLGQPSYFSLGNTQHEQRRVSSSHRSDSGGSETLTHMLSAFSLNDHEAGMPMSSMKLPHDEEGIISASPEMTSLNMIASKAGAEAHAKSPPQQSSMMPPAMALFDPEDTNRRFVGTPDYLAPETIKGDKQDETSDWWSVGCILFEFLYGIPPFHAGEAEHVFENILARKIMWPPEDPDAPVSEEAKDLINKLLCMDPQERLGANKNDKFASGGEEIRAHPWFSALSWDTLLEDEPQFVPQPENPEDTEYFDPRGASLQAFTEELEEHLSPQSSSAGGGGGGSDYADRPHDALSRVRSQVNQIHRKLMPLHIPPHVRDSKSRRLSEPLQADDFGSFVFKNLSALGKANKDLIEKLRAEAVASQSKAATSATIAGGARGESPAPSVEGSPVVAHPVQRTISNAKAANRPQSPSGYGHSNASPSRVSQPSSPLLVSFVAGQGTEGRRKASSNSSSLSHQSTSNLQPPTGIEIPKVPPSLQKAATSLSSSPIKGKSSAAPPPPLSLPPQKVVSTPSKATHTPTTSRSRSLTVGSQEGSPVTADALHRHRSRRSQVFDMSPSSSDNEGEKHNALLRVQRRRQSSRRLSQIAFDGGPSFRPLNVLICEDHPVARMVMEKLLEKLRCRTISVPNGSEAVRYSMSEIQFDVIFLEFKLPQINGTDVARMIRETKNANSHTPIVAITAYLKELQAPHHFDSLIEKPISSSKLTEVLRGLCHWRPDSPGQAPSSGTMPPPPPQQQQPASSGLRRATTTRTDDASGSSSSTFLRQGSSVLSSVITSREDSVSASTVCDSESATTDEPLQAPSRKGTGDWDDGGLGITEQGAFSEGIPRIPQLTLQRSAPPQLERTTRPTDKSEPKKDEADKSVAESMESADDEDEELGQVQVRDRQPRRSNGPQMGGKSSLPSSKLGVEMMRANSHDSAIESESTPEAVTQVMTTPCHEMESMNLESKDAPGPEPLPEQKTPPPQQSNATGSDADSKGNGPPVDSMDATPRPQGPNRSSSTAEASAEDDATPRAAAK
ncbi:uncharacterized protein F5Z01DRAFT_70858 [Emericellopsis atlantica]|uniref:non-specific serine/threonine protein kinase n=1 Tax=Emericellopsis atlantica TaxID=2614577 RepID=A0A9P7ZN81_9HYPO|nr:uncharacterized protein F5Z01DRAFT_70858 [Emericellopsis atlantica]KAG9255041.1 hypothetical protein F5Z01DRAFT_70858 [Emericellopsis atlantica]